MIRRSTWCNLRASGVRRRRRWGRRRKFNGTGSIATVARRHIAVVASLAFLSNTVAADRIYGADTAITGATVARFIGITEVVPADRRHAVVAAFIGVVVITVVAKLIILQLAVAALRQAAIVPAVIHVIIISVVASLDP